MNLTSTRKFGIEIECKGLSKQQATEAIQAKGLDCRLEGYNHTTRSGWKIVPDASVLDGFEVVSPILQGPEGLAQVEKVSAALVAAGGKVQKDCGFHVHVDAQDLSGATLINIVNRYARYEAQIDAFMPSSRRGSNNYYCKPMASVANTLSSLGLTASTQQVMGQIHDRYWKLNLASFVRHGTVEFRQHSGTVESKKMIPWIIFCINFVEASRVVVNREEVGGDETLRKNAIEKKFAILAQLLDEHNCRSNYVSTGTLAVALNIETSKVSHYISQFRSRYPTANICVRRGRGYFRGCTPELSSLVGITASTVTVRTQLPSDTGVFQGLETEVVSYFQERAMDLAS